MDKGATILAKEASELLQMNKFAEAEPLLLRALRIEEQDPRADPAQTSRILSNLATLYSIMGDFVRAQPLYERALKVRRDAGFPPDNDLAGILNNLASVYELTANYTNAEPLYQQALEVRRKVRGPDNEDTAAVLDNLGCLYKELGDFDKAQPLFEQALEIDTKKLGADHPNTAAVLNDLAELHLARVELDQAKPLLWRALVVAEKTQSPSLLNRVQYNLRVMLAKQNHPEIAILFGKKTVNRLQSMRGQQRQMDRELQESFLRTHGDYYRGLAALLVDAGRLGEAEQVLKMLKEEEFFEFIQRDAAAAQELSATAPLVPNEAQWALRLDAVATNIVSLANQRDILEKKQDTLTPSETEQLKRLSSAMDAAGHHFQTVLDEIQKQADSDATTAAQVSRRNLYDVSAMQSTLTKLGPGTVLLHYIVLPEKLYILLTTTNAQASQIVNIDSQTLNRRISEFRAVLRDRTQDPVPLAKELYRLVLAPVAPLLEAAGAKTLMVSLDGTLRYIPLAALHDGARYVAQIYRVAVFTEAGRDKLREPPKGQWRVAALGLSKKVQDFEPLPYVERELAGIVKVKFSDPGVLPGIIRLDNEFTTQELKRDLIPDNSVLHIASHFVFRPGQASDSYLVLGDGSHMSLDDMRFKQHLRFDDVDLLTLSACQTAASEVRVGSGIEMEGFAEVAQKQGAKAILATLWCVADVSTCEFMKSFYRLRQGAVTLSKAEALQRAQVSFIEGRIGVMGITLAKNDARGIELKPRITEPEQRLYQADPNAPYAHPYYWAPFVLIGNWL